MTTIPAEMTAAVQHRYGTADEIRVTQCPVPVPGAHEVLMRVDAAALNPADIFMMTGSPAMLRLMGGLFRPRQPVRGTDAAGTVVAVGGKVTRWQVGDRVFGETRGSLAEFTVAKEDRIAALPAGVEARAGAASVMAALAALHGLRHAGLDPYPQGRHDPAALAGKRVLVIGAGGGIGSFVVQMAAHAGATVTGVASGGAADAVRALGADRTVDYAQEDVLELEPGFDLIFDNVGANRMADLVTLVAPGGMLLPNAGTDGADGGGLMRVAKATWHGQVRRRPISSFYSAPKAADLDLLGALLAAGDLTPLIGAVRPLSEASAAVQSVADGHARGKVVVLP
ncbi:NAD(P)-dependent alcohol dehydrogenase [Demequina sp. B12]|uniref:NAD(P)-dependent alcohol dehydrogenase n=1 Tax=Demequina sp. B12 TaxID=2992757 RepID=UPI00237AEC05|nr:NAD(P)-dependent alcohol dehydrogenase [Demequina sp. B12]MDE0572201.1 NAD(P)-dependent alcohol dehydrogenase [Demequina sp. B12]